MRHLTLLTACLGALSTGACFSPDYGASGFACSEEGECPVGYECGSDGICYKEGTAPGAQDGGAPDAPQADAEVLDDGGTAPDASTLPDADMNNAPANDQCNAAATLAEGQAVVGSLNDAFDDDSYSCGANDRAEVYYSFTIGTDRLVNFTLGSTFDTSLVVLGSDCSSEILCSADSALGETPTIENLPAGTYFVAVESATGASGEFSLEFETDAPIIRPPNDECEGAIELVDGATRTGDTLELALGDASSSCAGAALGDVFYSFTVPAGANRRAILTVDNAVGFDPSISLQGQSCPGSEESCANDRDDEREQLDLPDLSPGTYLVAVKGDGATPTTFDISFELRDAVPPPGNDDCSAPGALVENTPVDASTTGAADDLELACLASDSRDAVHEFTIAQDSAVLVSLNPVDGWALAASLRDATMCALQADLSCIASAFETRYINKPNLAAGDYDVVVDGANGEHGDYSILYETRAVDTTFGYWLISSTGTYEPLGAGATVVLNDLVGDTDEEIFPLALPFTFPFFGEDKTDVNVHSNGFMSFDALGSGLDPVNFNNDCPLDETTPFDLIAPFWEDMKGQVEVDLTTTLKHELQGVAPNRRLVIEWGSWDIFESSPCSGQCNVLGADVNHQAILYENGDIEFRYGPRTAPAVATGCGDQHLGCSATIGIRSPNGADVDLAGCDTSGLVDDGTVFYFVHPR